MIKFIERPSWLICSIDFKSHLDKWTVGCRQGTAAPLTRWQQPVFTSTFCLCKTRRGFVSTARPRVTPPEWRTCITNSRKRILKCHYLVFDSLGSFELINIMYPGKLWQKLKLRVPKRYCPLEKLKIVSVRRSKKPCPEAANFLLFTFSLPLVLLSPLHLTIYPKISFLSCFYSDHQVTDWLPCQVSNMCHMPGTLQPALRT